MPYTIKEDIDWRKNTMKVVMNMDYYDDVITSETPYDETLIEQFMINCKENGVDIVNWRLSICGKRAYRSKTRAEDVYREGPSNVDGSKMKEILERFDPLEVAIELAHRHGIRLYAWIDLLDEYYMRPGDTVGLESRYFMDHPQYTWISRDGKDHMLGVPCYEYPEVVEYRLREIEEVLDYDIDGLYLCTRSHAKFNVPHREEDYYGFNEPWMNKYIEQYGVDPRTEEFDSELLAAIRGESITEFLRLASVRVRNKGIPLVAGIDKYPDSLVSIYPSGKLFIDWKTWAQEGIIDELSACASEDVYIHTQEWLEEVTVDMAGFCDSHGVKLGIWLLLWDWGKKYERPNGKQTKPPEAFKEMMQRLSAYPKLNSVFIHEALNVELLHMWHVIKGED